MSRQANNCALCLIEVFPLHAMPIGVCQTLSRGLRQKAPLSLSISEPLRYDPLCIDEVSVSRAHITRQ